MPSSERSARHDAVDGSPVTRDRRSVEVVADWIDGGGPQLMGTLHGTLVRNKEVFAFDYATSWLGSTHARTLDPDLHLLPGPQYAPQGRDNFGAFLDSAPDRWGRVLMKRREALRARREGRRPRPLSELDYLLGVFDGHRLGALRFRSHGGRYLDDDAELASPPWTQLRELEAASRVLEREGVEDDPEYGKWLGMLIAPGRSLGGARPKASVLDEKQRLWIAKFPSEQDTDDLGAWEIVVHRLARRAGVSAPESVARRFGSRHHTFLSRRFDRASTGGRIHFASAMALTGRADGEEGASYLDLAEVLMRHGCRPAQDLEQLFRRIVFNLCVSNIDDHLRNHGFLLEPDGWALSPAYDMNPVAGGRGLTLNVSETDNTLDLDLVREVAPSFRVAPPRAAAIIDEVREAVRGWDAEARAAGLSRSERDDMADAFRLAT